MVNNSCTFESARMHNQLSHQSLAKRSPCKCGMECGIGCLQTRTGSPDLRCLRFNSLQSTSFAMENSPPSSAAGCDVVPFSFGSAAAEYGPAGWSHGTAGGQQRRRMASLFALHKTDFSIAFFGPKRSKFRVANMRRLCTNTSVN